MLIETGIVFSVLLAVVVRRRRTADPQDQPQPPPPPPSAPRSPPSRSPYIWSILLIISALIIYYIYNKDPIVVKEEPKCKPISVEERVRTWDYTLSTAELRNVSQNANSQVLFNQAMVMRWGFAQYPAQKTFEEALELDPNCAMCYWGMAYSRAPFANIVAFPTNPGFPYYSTKDNQNSREWLQLASRLPPRSSKETRYIEIMQTRFPEVQEVDKEEQEWFEFLYGVRMLMLWQQDPPDLEAGVLAIEAFINCIPWDYYNSHILEVEQFNVNITWQDLIKSTFTSNPRIQSFTLETGVELESQVLVDFALNDESMNSKMKDPSVRDLARVAEHLLLKIMESEPDHPLALHLHIHLTEASEADGPDKGLTSADRLSVASTHWKSPHLVHMPSHIYARLGQYTKVVLKNEEAHEMDFELSENCIQPYLPEHNLRVLLFGASMGGFLSKAEECAKLLRKLPERIVSSMYMSKGREYIALLHVWGRFGQWDAILTMDEPYPDARGDLRRGGLPFARTMFHYYRFLAFSHLEQVSPQGRKLLVNGEPKSEIEFLKFQDSAKEVEKKPSTLPGVGLGIYSAAYWENTNISLHYAFARLASLKGDFDSAIDHFTQVEALVEELGYMEPPYTPQPARQCHGYLLLAAGKHSEAKKVYEKDLEENPNNPWSTLGLAQVYKAMKLEKEATSMLEIYKSLNSAPLGSSCPILQLD